MKESRLVAIIVAIAIVLIGAIEIGGWFGIPNFWLTIKHAEDNYLTFEVDSKVNLTLQARVHYEDGHDRYAISHHSDIALYLDGSEMYVELQCWRGQMHPDDPSANYGTEYYPISFSPHEAKLETHIRCK